MLISIILNNMHHEFKIYENKTWKRWIQRYYIRFPISLCDISNKIKKIRGHIILKVGHCAKSVRIRSYFGLYFPQNTNQTNFEYGHFLWLIWFGVSIWSLFIFDSFLSSPLRTYIFKNTSSVVKDHLNQATFQASFPLSWLMI